MPPRTFTAPKTGAIRFGIVVLGAIGFVLSYDALRQMAVAAHIRALFTFGFPLVIDGFIGIGIGTLLLLRSASTLARVYVWVLVGLATVISIWANALHAVRLNQQSHDSGLHLGDWTVGILSALPPLALAGAVHLYQIVQREPEPTTEQEDTDSGDGATLDVQPPTPLKVADAPADVALEGADVADSSASSPEPSEEEPEAVAPELLAVARRASRGRGGKASRRHIEDAIRSTGRPIGKDEAERIKDVLQAELDEAAARESSEGAHTAVAS
ncbi:DUF2637 domain-containing protein [Streptomyces sp. NPDC056210]|uniref:DUF2637 domain-containing protein n=1 Tax=unclassified Streptomyces TaxID=2593676 RepID=UPI0035D7A117